MKEGQIYYIHQHQYLKNSLLYLLELLLELARDELKSKNVKIIGNIREEPYGKLLTFEDPDGHWLEFYQLYNE